MPPGRRDLLAGLIAGFTPAIARAATALHTGSEGLADGAILLQVNQGPIPAYYARPDGAGPFPTILVIEEIFGVHEYIRDVCRRLAHEGYLAIAPEIYARFPNFPKMTDPAQIVREVISHAPDALVMSDCDGALAWAEANRGDPARLGVLGFCRGGRDAWLYAEHNPRLRAAVAFYGPVNTPDTPIQPKSPLDLAATLKCPLLGLYGGQDTSISQTDVQAAATRARAAGQTVEIRVYQDAPHGFHADYRSSYRPADAKDAWARALAWFRHYGV